MRELHVRVERDEDPEGDGHEQEHRRAAAPPVPGPVADGREVDLEEADGVLQRGRAGAGDGRPGARDQAGQPGDQHRVAAGALDDRQVGRHALVEVDDLVDLLAGQPARPPGPAEQQLEPVPLAPVRGDVRVEVHAPDPTVARAGGQTGRVSQP